MVLSFVVAGAEVAFFSLTHKDINLLKTKPQPAYKRVVDLLEEPKILLASLLVANTFLNIAIIIIFNILLNGISQVIPFHAEWLMFLIKAVLVAVVLCGSITPRKDNLK